MFPFICKIIENEIRFGFDWNINMYHLHGVACVCVSRRIEQCHFHLVQRYSHGGNSEYVCHSSKHMQNAVSVLSKRTKEGKMNENQNF